MCNITELFCKKFRPWDITINESDVVVGNRKVVPKGDWHLKWLVGEDDKGIFLEYYGIYAKREHFHERIYRSGEEEVLDALRQYISYAPTIPGDRERGLQDLEKYNRQVMCDLREKGLI